jgi:uncharacterized protein YcaQ
VARVDLKADRKGGKLHVLSTRFEAENIRGQIPPADREAVRTALVRYADALGLEPLGGPV